VFKKKIGRSKQMELSKMVLIGFLVIAVVLIVLMVVNGSHTAVATPTVVVARTFDLSGYGNSYKAQYYN
jgi:hypothetical protein